MQNKFIDALIEKVQDRLLCGIEEQYQSSLLEGYRQSLMRRFNGLAVRSEHFDEMLEQEVRSCLAYDIEGKLSEEILADYLPDDVILNMDCTGKTLLNNRKLKLVFERDYNSRQLPELEPIPSHELEKAREQKKRTFDWANAIEAHSKDETHERSRELDFQTKTLPLLRSNLNIPAEIDIWVDHIYNMYFGNYSYLRGSCHYLWNVKKKLYSYKWCTWYNPQEIEPWVIYD